MESQWGFVAYVFSDIKVGFFLTVGGGMILYVCEGTEYEKRAIL